MAELPGFGYGRRMPLSPRPVVSPKFNRKELETRPSAEIYMQNGIWAHFNKNVATFDINRCSRTGLTQAEINAAASYIHEQWMARNPWGSKDQMVPYARLTETEKEKDRVHLDIIARLIQENPSGSKEYIVDMFGAKAHEAWRDDFEPKWRETEGTQAHKSRDKPVDNGFFDINSAWEGLPDKFKLENLKAGHAAYDAYVYKGDVPPSAGGASKKKKVAKKTAKAPAAAKWESLRRKVTTRSGEVRTLYRNSSTGEMRVKRMTTRAGKRVVAYIKP